MAPVAMETDMPSSQGPATVGEKVTRGLGLGREQTN